MEDRGEIEFFDFVPIHFVNELESEIQNLVKHNKSLLDSCKKNMFIFKNFVLRNILRFPNNFTFERKKTDLVVDSFSLSTRKLELQNQIQTKLYNISVLRQKSSNLDLLLQDDVINKASSNIRSIREKYNSILEYLSSLPFQSEDNFNYLLEYREIRSEILKKEWEDLNSRIQL